MASLKIRKDDEVVVISGKDKGKTGRVLRVDPEKSRVYVEGLNIIKRHMRPQQVPGAQRSETIGGVVEKEGVFPAPKGSLSAPRTKNRPPAASGPGAGKPFPSPSAPTPNPTDHGPLQDRNP